MLSNLCQEVASRSLFIEFRQFEINNLNIIFQIVMKPRRPDSAKTQQTKRTLDSDHTKQDLNSSKFSETFSAGVNSIHQKPDQFKKYVSQKDKDPRFKHLAKTTKLQVIEQKASKNEEQKPYKPFQKKKVVQNSQKKVEQPPEKAEDLMSLSKGFAQKNKQKMNSLKMSISQQKQQEQKVNEKPKPKINFTGFKVNKPGEKKEVKKESQSPQAVKKASESKPKQEKSTNQSTKPTVKKGGKTEQQIQRAEEIKNLERFVSGVEARNMEFFPSNYDRVIAMTPHSAADLQKIDLNNFLEEPTEDDYERMKFNIHQLDNQIDEQKVEQSIDLQAIIDGETETDRQSQMNESYLNSMTSVQLKKHNAFLTQVLAGKISKKEIDQLQEMNKSAMRIYKLEHQKEEEDDQLYLTEINMVKKQSNRLIERNRLEAAGHLYRDCDYLSQEHKKRLQQLLNGDIGESPFQCNELESYRRRGIDEGIRMYREMNCSEETSQIFNEQSLPKDPLLKKQAQKKVLKEKMNNVNQRLANVDKVEVTKAKIQALIKNFEHTRHSASYQQLLQQNQRKFQQQYQHLQEAERLLATMGQKQNVEEIMKDIQEQFNQLQRQIKVFQELDQQQLRRMQKERLKRKLRQLQAIQTQNKDLEQQIASMQNIKREVEQKLKLYDEVQPLIIPSLICEGYQPGQTLEDIDEIITKKMNLHNQSL